MNPNPSYEELKRKLIELEKEMGERKRIEIELANELKKFRGLYDLATAITSDQSLDAYLGRIVDQCRELLSCDISYIALHDEIRNDFYKHTFSGIRTEAFRDMRLPSGKGLGGLVARTLQGCIVEDYPVDTRFDRRDDKIIAGEGIRSGMAVPIRMGTKTMGVLYVFNRSKTPFSQSDLATLHLVGHLAAVEISRRQAEDLLRESEERFRFMLETTGDVIYRLDYETMCYDYLSPGIGSLTGFSQEEIKTLGFSSIVKRIDLPGAENVGPEVLVENRMMGKTGEFRADYLITTRNGDSRWLRDHSFPWFDSSGRLVGSVGILSDVTDYKRAEALVRQRTAELVESEEKYRTLVENVPLVVYRLSPAGEVIFINQFAEVLTGYSPVDILRDSRVWDEAVHDEDRPRVMEQRRKAYVQRRELMVEYRIVHRDGYLVYVVEHAIPFEVPGGDVTSVDGIIMDVTGRVKLQEKLIQTEGIRTISEVSARLAHEIRNPLVSAGGFARRLLSSMNPDDPNREKVEIIVKEVGRLEAILRMILNYMQPVELQISPADPYLLVDAASMAVETDAVEKQVSVRIKLPPGLPKIPVDPYYMEQTLKTLFRNAFTRMPPGSALTLSGSLEKDLFLLTLKYPAQNVSRDDVEHFFYPFTTPIKTGLAPVDLPMSKILVHKHGGMIEVKLEKPRTMLIRILLPTCPGAVCA